MGCYTEILLFIPPIENDNQIEKVNTFFTDGRHDPYKYPGLKQLETIPSMYEGCYKHLSQQDFIDHLKTLQWEYPEIVQLMVHNDCESENWQIINIFAPDPIDIDFDEDAIIVEGSIQKNHQTPQKPATKREFALQRDSERAKTRAPITRLPIPQRQ